MKRTAIAALCLGAATALAQFRDVPTQKCEPKPQYPGLKAMRSDVEVKAFEAAMKGYKECIMAYISERKAAAKAHDAAATAASEEHNMYMARIRANQERALQEAAASEAAKPETEKPAAKKY